MLILGLLFVAFALQHPEMSFPWPLEITRAFYVTYSSAIILFFLLAFLEFIQKKTK